MGYDYMRALDKACYLGRQEERTASTNFFLFFFTFYFFDTRGTHDQCLENSSGRS